MQLENLKNTFINNLILNQNNALDNSQNNLVSIEDYENILKNTCEVIKNNPDDDITSLRKKIYDISPLNQNMKYIINDLDLADSLTITYGTNSYNEKVNIGMVNNKKANEKNIYDLASVSKLFTSISVLKLTSLGLIDLNKDVAYYDERFKYLKNTTIFSLLTFNAPLITNGRLDDEGISYEESKERLLNIKINESFNPTLSPYTDLGAMVLKEVIETITNQNFYEFVKENILNTSNMDNTYIIVPKERLYLTASTDNTISYKNNKFIFRKVRTGTVNDEKAKILGQNVNDFMGHAGLFSTPIDMSKFANSIMDYKLLNKDYLNKMSKNMTGRYIESLNKYRQYFGCLCYVKNPDKKASEVYHPLSANAFAMGGYTGNQFTVDPQNKIFAFLCSNRTHNRIVNLSGFDKNKIIKDINGKQTIVINGKEYVNSSSFANQRDIILKSALDLAISYSFLEYYITSYDKNINLSGTLSRTI